MMRLIAIILAVAVAVPLIAKADPLPAPYKDGCSGGVSWFYRNVLGEVPVWEACCDAHDKLYGPGGTSDQRAAADHGLYECVKKTGHAIAASVMWFAVRIGGQPYFPFDWRWGFETDLGWTQWYSRSGAE